MKLYTLSIVLLFLITLSKQSYSQPKLIVGITIDQMRYDYLYRYWNDYGETGFKRLLAQGYSGENCHYSYSPTYTGPGHASIFTGTTPSVHGIMGNNWYSREESSIVYCVQDNAAKTIGSTSAAGKMSPRRLLSTTIGDQLKLSSNLRSKVIGIALKDRGAILPAGYLADGAYWYDKNNGLFVTSDFYKKDQLPAWANQFNNKKLADRYLNQVWNPLLSMKEYDESLPDDKLAKKPLSKGGKAVFPYNLPELKKQLGYELLNYTPFGNSITFEMAKAAIEGEKLGADNFTDLLAVSFSTPDYAGHQFGPYSVEIQDIYVRLDRELGEFLDYIDKQVGIKNTLIFITADHGAADPPALIMPPAGFFDEGKFEKDLRAHLLSRFGQDPIESIINENIYFKRNINLDRYKLYNEATNFILTNPAVESVIDVTNFSNCMSDLSICNKIKKGFNSPRSGDLIVVTKPGWISDWSQPGGTTHGSYYDYDTHVPLIFYGYGISGKKDYSLIHIEDIAPTVSNILHITSPSGTTGKIIEGVLNIMTN